MNMFKHIIIFVLMLLAYGLTANAQNTMVTPIEGTTHSYTCDGITEGVNYEFYITANADGTGLYDDGLTVEFDIISSTDGTIGVDGLASTDIQWNVGASDHIYYLWLEATIPGGCSNNISLEITPQVNAFDLLSENIPVTNTTSCPDLAASSGFDIFGTSTGTTVLTFSVKRENGTDNTITPISGDTYDWSFIPQLTVDPNLGLANYIITIEGNISGLVPVDANGRYTISGFDDEVIVSVSIENAPGENREVNFKVTEQRENNTNLLDSDPTNDNVTHTIEVMPVIGGMGGA